MIEQVFGGIVTWYMGHINYWTVILLMTVESSFIPFPSEIVVPPAAWKAAQGEMNLFLVIGAGTVGSILGALINYYLALWIGRKMMYTLADTKLAHLMLIDRAGIEKAERWFIKYGKSSTFIGRLVPAIRQLISLPAGLAMMNMKDFLVYTTLGSGIWNVVLAVLGFYLYSQKEILDKYYREISYGCAIAGLLFAVYVISRLFVKPKGEAMQK
jgi:membrane protein DedA with SNARE-associated domain